MTNTIPILTLQQIFDKVSAHLLTQNDRSMGNLGVCMYLSSKGLKCAVGCLIPESLYTPRIEGCAVNSSLVTSHVEGKELLRGILKELGLIQTPRSLELLESLQNLHDNSGVSDWPTGLRAIAFKFSLDDSVVVRMTVNS